MVNVISIKYVSITIQIRLSKINSKIKAADVMLNTVKYSSVFALFIS